MDTVKIDEIEFVPNSYRMVIQGSGHPTEFLEACQDIAKAILRGKERWWFQSIRADLSENAAQVSNIHFDVEIRFGT